MPALAGRGRWKGGGRTGGRRIRCRRRLLPPPHAPSDRRGGRILCRASRNRTRSPRAPAGRSSTRWRRGVGRAATGPSWTHAGERPTRNKRIADIMESSQPRRVNRPPIMCHCIGLRQTPQGPIFDCDGSSVADPLSSLSDFGSDRRHGGRGILWRTRASAGTVRRGIALAGFRGGSFGIAPGRTHREQSSGRDRFLPPAPRLQEPAGSPPTARSSEPPPTHASDSRRSPPPTRPCPATRITASSCVPSRWQASGDPMRPLCPSGSRGPTGSRSMPARSRLSATARP